jgi:spore germination cell wall hydrolase CwlJ-like protein
MNQSELKCLADNIYYEARGESKVGMLLVAKTTINRSEDPDFPNDICKVVYQKDQFSWTSTKQNKPDSIGYSKAKEIAIESTTFKTPALYFHNQTVKPQWAKTKVVVAIEGNHIFYK